MSMKLDKSFFEKLLRKYENDNSITIIRMEFQKAFPYLANFTSKVLRYTFNGTREIKAHSKDVRLSVVDYFIKLIVKVKPEDEKQTYQFSSDICFENESKAYNKVIPVLNQFAPIPLPVPKFLFVDGSVVILEDLLEKGLHEMHGCIALTPKEAETVLKVLANIHASSFIIKQKQPNLFEELKSAEETIFMPDRDSPLLKRYASRISLAMEVMQFYRDLPEYETISSMLQDFNGKTVMNLLRDMVLSSQNDVHAVITHGDLWMNNFLFKGDEVYLIDFQCMRCGSVALDLSYFLHINVMPSVLEENIDSLLAFYLGHLNKGIKSRTVGMENELTISWLQNEMKRYCLYGMMSALFTFHGFYLLDKLNLSTFIGVQQTAEIMPLEHKERIKDVLISYVKNTS